MPLLIMQILIVASLGLSIYMIVITLERCRSEKRYGFIYCIVTLFLYNLGYLIEISAGNLEGAIIGVKITYAGGSFMAVFFFFFVADYCELRIPKKYYQIPLLIVPVLHYCVVLTFDHHHLLYLSYFYNSMKTFPDLGHVQGPLYLVGQLYPVFCVILSIIVLIRSIIAQSKGRRFALVLLLVSALAPMFAQLAYLIVLHFLGTSLLFTAFLTLVSNFIFYYNIVRKDMFDLSPKAHAVTMDMIRDAFIVLDWDMAYTGSNRKALELFPGLAELQKGASILKLENWPGKLTGETGKPQPEGEQRNEIEFSLPHKPGKTYSGWKNPITSESGATLGWVILIQDISETVSLIRSIRTQRDEIAAMRDNLKEGIFLMDREFTIQDSYSRAMEVVLSDNNLHGRRFIDLLGKSLGAKEIGIIADYFTMMMDKSVPAIMLEDINPLKEFTYISNQTGEQKTLQCIFAPVERGGGETFVLGTIQDITAETILKKQLSEEEDLRQEEMRRIFEVMHVDQKVLRDFIEDAEYEFNRAKENLQSQKTSGKQKLVNLYQSIHAVKSNALIINLTVCGMKLHDFEAKIRDLRDKEDEPDPGGMKMIGEELEKNIEEKQKIIEVVERLSSVSSSAGARKDDEVFLDGLKQACRKVAGDENKKAILVTESFDREALNIGPRRLMKDILNQLVRNAVHHGIESPEERIAMGKEETGRISLRITLEGNVIRMSLSDNGQGLDYKRIAETARAKGLLDNKTNEEIDVAYLSNLIFSPGFSTSETDGIHAGRGIGLNLVKTRTLEAKGKIRLQSKKGQGTVFEILIPV